jgi:hypothetical protein
LFSPSKLFYVKTYFVSFELLETFVRLFESLDKV